MRAGHRASRGVAGLLAALAVAGAAGCAAHDGGTSGAFARAAHEAASAASAGALVVGLAEDGSVTTPLLDTVLADGLADVRAAETAVAGRQVTTGDDADDQQRVLAAVDDARAALVEARAWATGGRDGDGTGVAQALQDAADALTALADEIEPA